MTFWEHLEEARWSIFRMLAAFLFCLIPAFIFLPWIFENLILAAAQEESLQLINIQIASQFTTHIRLAVYLALLAAAPYILYEIWRFVRPALYPNEKKTTRFAFLSGGILFYIGCAIGIGIIFPLTFHFLANYELSPLIENQINLNSYIQLFNAVVFCFGICFELPVLIWILGRMGLVNKNGLKKYRRHAIAAMLILSAIITPSGDPITLLVVFTPLYLLYELSILFVRK